MAERSISPATSACVSPRRTRAARAAPAMVAARLSLSGVSMRVLSPGGGGRKAQEDVGGSLESLGEADERAEAGQQPAPLEAAVGQRGEPHGLGHLRQGESGAPACCTHGASDDFCLLAGHGWTSLGVSAA